VTPNTFRFAGTTSTNFFSAESLTSPGVFQRSPRNCPLSSPLARVLPAARGGYWHLGLGRGKARPCLVHIAHMFIHTRVCMFCLPLTVITSGFALVVSELLKHIQLLSFDCSKMSTKKPSN